MADAELTPELIEMDMVHSLLRNLRLRLRCKTCVPPKRAEYLAVLARAEAAVNALAGQCPDDLLFDFRAALITEQVEQRHLLGRFDVCNSCHSDGNGEPLLYLVGGPFCNQCAGPADG